MSLPEQAIIEFKELFRLDYGYDLTDEEATEKAGLLFNGLEVLVKQYLTKYSAEEHHDT